MRKRPGALSAFIVGAAERLAHDVRVAGQAAHMTGRAMSARTIFPLALAAAALAQPILSQTMRSVWDGVYTAGQAKRGQALFAKECAACHGDDLTGGESAPPLAGQEFLSEWTGLAVGALFERTRVSMPANNAGKLSRAQVADVIAYMLSANHFPEGKAELDTETDVLKQIRIDAEAPKK